MTKMQKISHLTNTRAAMTLIPQPKPYTRYVDDSYTAFNKTQIYGYIIVFLIPPKSCKQNNRTLFITVYYHNYFLAMKYEKFESIDHQTTGYYS